MFKYIKYGLSLAVLLTTLPLTTSAKKKITVDLNQFQAHGTNALDYVLQKPLPADTFPAEDKGFGKHFFLGASGGFSALGNSFTGGVRPGLYIGGELGSWFTPVHGIRLAGDLGIMSVHSGISRCWYGSLQADYLMNLTSLLRGYNPTRKFELIWSIGVDLRRLRQLGSWHSVGGLATSLQARFNVAPSLYIFVEPRLAMLTGYRYDGKYNWSRLNADLSLSLGLGYRIQQGRWRAMASTSNHLINDDGFYFGAGAGAWGLPRQGFRSLKNPFATAFVGKQLSSESSLQLSLSFDQYRQSAKHKYAGIGSLDYVLNLGNACGGYRPNAVFQTLVNVGVAGGMITRAGDERVMAPGISVGITGLFRLSENWGIYIHPQAYLFTRKFARALYGRQSPLTAVDLGVRYTIGDFSRLHPVSYETYNADSRHWFISAGIGGAKRLRGSFGPGADIFVGFGKRFTPVSSWRLQLIGDGFPRMPRALDATIHFDYLTSITTAMYGYDPDRVFDLQGVLGVFGGAGQYDGDMKAVFGLTGGLQFNFRLNKYLDLYVEPQFLAASAPMARNGRNWIPELRAQLGLRYKLGTPIGGRGSIGETPYGDRRNFVGIAGMPAVFTGNITGRNMHITGGLDLTLGRWFSMVSGLRLTYANDWVYRHAKTHYLGALHLNYLLNFTSLFDRNADRRFHIIGALGGGLGISPDTSAKTFVMAYAGVQFRYNLPWNIDVHIEPGFSAWPNRLIPGAASSARFEAEGRLAVGASYRF
ncbi:MAG: hypothetical protein NC301_04340 [Bacteroides sp.]|nr:hypothetical protein [Bacteroides sp.]MCM1379686.1 hypothetical protein [Bacteroides sp.]MCM1446041.1 hypothetical protein [Prevotella sp.]